MTATITPQQPQVKGATSGERKDRSSWLWLALGGVLLSLTLFQWVVPIAAWLAPLFLQRFVRTTGARLGLTMLFLVGSAATFVSLQGIWVGSERPLFALAGGLAVVVVYGIDRAMSRRLRGLARTLVLPAADTAFGYLGSLDHSSFFASWAATGYSQAADLPFLQTGSLIGMWGVGFLVVWTAAVVNEWWDHDFQMREVRRPLSLWAAVMAGCLLFGGIQVALAPADVPSVTVAALGPDRILDQQRDGAPFRTMGDTAEERALVNRQYLDPVIDDLFQRTRETAAAGAKIVAWAEAAAFVYEEDRDALIERGRSVAREEGIYLEMAVVTVLPTHGFPSNLNQSILLGPDGAVLWEYDKSSVVPGDGNQPGPGLIPVVDTPYGRLAVAICFDGDFPALVRQVGQADADILLLPTSEWKSIAPVHADMAVFRAVENGVSVVRPARRGYSSVIDPYGEVIAFDLDAFVGEDPTLIAEVPTEGRDTLYAAVGDVVPQGSLLALLALGSLATTRAIGDRRRGRLEV